MMFFRRHIQHGCCTDIIVGKKLKVTMQPGRAIVQGVSRWFSTAAAWVRDQIKSCGIRSGQSGTGQASSDYFGFSCQVSFHRLLHIHRHLSSGTGIISQTVVNVPTGLSLNLPQETITNKLTNNLTNKQTNERTNLLTN
jgi:hypothetical protein